MTAPKPGKIRKQSFLYEDLAHQIILPHQLAAMLILRYLAKCANDAGRHYVSRVTMCADCGLSFDTFNRALKYLKSLGILTWTKGHGNKYSDCNVANAYQLHQKRMQQLITEQGVFMASTRDYKPNLRLLNGDALTARVKLLPSVNEQFAATDHASTTTDDASTTTDYKFTTTDNRTLTLYDLPSTELPSVEDPLQSPPMVNLPTQDNPPSGAGVPQLGGTPQCIPLRPIISRAQPCADTVPPITKADRYLPRLNPEPCRVEQTMTFDDGMWESDKEQILYHVPAQPVIVRDKVTP